MKKTLLTIAIFAFALTTQAQICFGTRTDYTVGTNPRAIVTGDFNGDSKLDLAQLNQGSNNVSILMGSGTGTFAAAVNYTANSSPYEMATADLNADGKLDLVIANAFANNVSILFGTASGTFTPKVDYIVGTEPYGISLADFNGDGKLDIATANYNSANVSILLGSASGTFAAAVNYAAGVNAIGVAHGDYNGDGKLDLAVTNWTSGALMILIGSGSGTFAAPVSYAGGGSQPYKILTYDFNGDSKLDLAVSNRMSGTVSIFIGSGSGTFAAANFGGTTISILLGSPSGIFATAVNYTVALYPWGICKGDFNGDGKDDIAAGNANGGGGNNTSVLLDQTTSVNSGSICAGQSFTMVPSGAVSYTFSSGSAIVSPLVNTNYTVTGTSGAGCVSSAVSSVAVSNCTGIQTLTNNELITVYPVPFNGEFTIQLPAKSHITIVDVLGKVVYADQLQEGKRIINLSNFDNGIYILKAENNGIISTTKLIKE